MPPASRSALGALSGEAAWGGGLGLDDVKDLGGGYGRAAARAFGPVGNATGETCRTQLWDSAATQSASS